MTLTVNVLVPEGADYIAEVTTVDREEHGFLESHAFVLPGRQTAFHPQGRRFIQVAERSNTEAVPGVHVTSMSFGHALHALKQGQRVARADWDGAFVVLMPALYLPPFNTQDTARKVNDRTAKWIGADQPLDCQPYLALYTASKLWQPGWLPSQADLMAEDWRALAPFSDSPAIA